MRFIWLGSIGTDHTRKFVDEPILIAGQTTYEEASLSLSDDSVSNGPVTSNPLFTGTLYAVNGVAAEYVDASAGKSFDCVVRLTRAVAGLYVHLCDVPESVEMIGYYPTPVMAKPDYMCITASMASSSVALASQAGMESIVPSEEPDEALSPYNSGIILAETVHCHKQLD